MASNFVECVPLFCPNFPSLVQLTLRQNWRQILSNGSHILVTNIANFWWFDPIFKLAPNFVEWIPHFVYKCRQFLLIWSYIKIGAKFCRMGSTWREPTTSHGENPLTRFAIQIFFSYFPFSSFQSEKSLSSFPMFLFTHLHLFLQCW
jgi:hypothetical protein